VEDPEKIKAKIKELNGGKDSGPWDEASGFSIMPSIAFDMQTKGYVITVDTGIMVKLFINTETGDTKTFWAPPFMKGGK